MSIGNSRIAHGFAPVASRLHPVERVTDTLEVGLFTGWLFPIRQIQRIEAYGGDDDASMAADNTSAFNCRFAQAAGPKRWSEHAYGRAIDVNPVENPYVEGARVSPPSGRAFANRSRSRPGMAVTGGVLVRAFAARGWSWGGRWTGTPDYQHFSTSGR